MDAIRKEKYQVNQGGTNEAGYTQVSDQQAYDDDDSVATTAAPNSTRICYGLQLSTVPSETEADKKLFLAAQN